MEKQNYCFMTADDCFEQRQIARAGMYPLLSTKEFIREHDAMKWARGSSGHYIGVLVTLDEYEKLKKWLKKVNIPAIAMGGVSEAEVEIVMTTSKYVLGEKNVRRAILLHNAPLKKVVELTIADNQYEYFKEVFDRVCPQPRWTYQSK